MFNRRTSAIVFLAFANFIGIASANGQDEAHIPHEVLAFYYDWYGVSGTGDHGNHWGKIFPAEHNAQNVTHFPEQGAYSSQKSAVVDSQISLARSNGMTGFIVSWWGQNTYEDHNVPVLMKSAENANFKVTIFWEKAPGKGEAQIDQAVDDLVYLITQFGSNTAFLRVNGKPVIFVYERVVSQLPEQSWPSIIGRVRAKAGPFLLIGDGYDQKNARLFNGLERYNISWAAARKSLDAIRVWAAKYDEEGVKLARQHGEISCATVIPGYDDTKVNKPGRIADRQDGQVYSVLWEEAIRAKPDWVVITSWNEWHEGTEIEPSVQDHDKYLRLTAKYSQIFLGGSSR